MADNLQVVVVGKSIWGMSVNKMRRDVNTQLERRDFLRIAGMGAAQSTNTAGTITLGNRIILGTGDPRSEKENLEAEMTEPVVPKFTP